MIYMDERGQKYDDAPVPREPEKVFCRFCKTREVIPDGLGDVVHADDYRYQCDPRNPKSTFADVRHGR